MTTSEATFDQGRFESALDERYKVYIKSSKGNVIHTLYEPDMMFSTLMQATFLSCEVFSSPDNPCVFSNASDKNLNIIVKYSKKCSQDREFPEPPKPLPRTTLPDILGDDYEIVQLTMESDMTDREKLQELTSLASDASYLGMNTLREKICAAIASIIVGKPMEAIKLML